MRRVWILSIALLCMITMNSSSIEQEGKIFPTHLRCEYKTNPLGIDVLNPRLTWELQSVDPTDRGLVQSAYQIVVVSSKENLTNNNGDIWDSGQIRSNQTSNIEFPGKSMASDKDFFWKVRVWDNDGKASAWSRTARWSIGLLNDSDWKAKWIETPFRVDFDLCRWIWHPEGNALRDAAEGEMYFRKIVSFPDDVSEGKIIITADDRFVLYLDGTEIAKSPAGENAWEKPQIIELNDISKGKHCIAIAAKNDTKGAAGLTGKCMFIANDTQYYVLIDNTWKVSKQTESGWMNVIFDDSKWEQAKELSFIGQGNNPWGVPGDDDNLILTPPPHFVKDVLIGKPVKRAMLYATAHGMFDIDINDQKVGDEFFRPGWSDYRNRLYYNTYDVSDQLHIGTNTLQAILADGWYTGYIGWGPRRNHYQGENTIKLQINVEYIDGTKEVIGTDSSWEVLANSPIRESDFLHGEVYDARLEDDISIYRNAVLAADQTDPEIELEAYPGTNVKAIREFTAIKVSEPKPGVYVYDLGQNLVGFARLKVEGPAGTAVQLRFAERLNEDGTLYLTNLRSARATDTYILKGEGIETWQPRFTFHGFRYVEVTGYPGHPPLDAVTGVVLHSEMEEAGSFECSNAMINQLIHNIDWGMRGNYLELPTDCPQRDERMGWMGDAQVFMRTGTYNKDIAAFFTKWLQDVVDSQRKDGSFTDVSPDIAGLGSGVAAWADAGVICPYTMYKVYGDTRILKRCYSSMQKFIEYLKTNSNNFIRPASGYADWLNLNAETPKDLLGTAYFAYSTRLMVEIAEAIGKSEDAKKYQQLYNDIRKAFIKKYLSGDGRLQGNTQTGYVLAFSNGLIPADKVDRAIYHLVRDLQVRNYHFSTGFAGLAALFPVLTKIDRNDLAYRLLLKDTFPSWGFEIAQGATTIWERWDGWTPEFGFQDPGMNSFNHYAYGSVGEWIYSVVGGIDTINPGFKEIQIWPRPGGEFRFVKAKYRSINGWIGSEWYDEETTFSMNVSIPVNTTAKVYVKARDTKSVTVDGESRYVKFIEMKDGYAVYEVKSGHYSFVSKK
jgi:alpha-L-rhamnosidase